ncbi:MAG: CheR family methyltransferase [Mycobacteriales bacterium]
MIATLSAEHLEQLALRLSQAAGLSFEPSRRQALSAGVERRMRELGVEEVSSYIAALDEPAELQAMIDTVTIQETQFYRNASQMAALTEEILPRLAAEAGGSPLQIWSAGCASGEEAYSLALLLLRIFGASAARSRARILATDVSTRALAAARAGCYGERSMAAVGAAERAAYFELLPDRPPTWRVGEPLRELVEFRRHNLVEAPPFSPGQLDLIVCRNVTIYFSRAVTTELMGRLHRALRPGGYLLLGHAETLWQICDQFVAERHGEAFLYRRPKRPPGGQPGRPASPRRRQALTVAQRAPRCDSRSEPRETVGADGLPALYAALRSGQHPRALTVADQLLEREPMLAEGHYLRGVALSNLGDDAAAVISLRRARYLQPGFGAAAFQLAGALERLGEQAAAARAYRAAAQEWTQRPGLLVAGELAERRPGELFRLCLELAERAEGELGAGTGG